MKPPMPYSGVKQRITAAIAELLPLHQSYVEPFAGAMSVLLAKEPSPMETVNDIDGDLVAFWRVLRDRPDDLERACALTPHSRAEYLASRDRPADIDDVERARRVWVHLSQSRGARMTRSGWRFVHGSNRFPLAAYLDGSLARIAPAAERLKHVSLECRDALDVIDAYGKLDACLYVDPPYLSEVRDGAQYAHEYSTWEQHDELLDALQRTPAAVVLSGYAHALYDRRLASWERRTFATLNMRGSARTEVVWVKPAGSTVPPVLSLRPALFAYSATKTADHPGRDSCSDVIPDLQ